MKYKILITVLITFMASTINFPINAQTNGAEKPNVAILIFDGVQIIDYTGPYEVLGSRRKRNVYTVAEKPEAVTTNMGMKVVPNYTFENQPKPDVIVIPGGGNNDTGQYARGVGRQLKNEKVISWIRENAKTAKYVLSVCNGAFLLAHAGLLDGMEATTTAGMIEELRQVAPKARVVSDKRYTDNGKIVTTAGLSSGIDGALHLVEKMDGRGWAQMIAIGIEYNWQPDADYARAALADRRLPRNLYRAFYADAEPVSFQGNRENWEEKWLVSRHISTAEILGKIDSEWTSVKDWSKASTDKTNASRWRLTDENGKTWRAEAVVENSATKEKFILTLKISLDQNKKGS